jgi:hypothetical protein
MAETIAPFAHLEDMAIQPLGGLNEIGGGIYSDAPPSSAGQFLYLATIAAWVAGLDFVQLPGGNDFNGVQFQENFGGAVDTMYNDAVADPVVSANGHITAIGVSGGAALATWILTNVKNPDLPFIISQFTSQLSGGQLLPTAGVSEVTGNPEDGWTLVSFGGNPVPEDPGLVSELFVDFRNLITAPQTAAYNIFEAALTTPTTIEDALQAGFNQVGSALVQFPESVINDTVTAVHNFGADVAAGETLSDAFASAILGLG